MKSETISSATNITYGLSLKMMSNYSVVNKSNVVLDLEMLPTTLVSPNETNVTFQEYTDGAIALALNEYYLWGIFGLGIIFNTAVVVLTVAKLGPFATSSIYVILSAVFDTLALLSKLTYLKLTYYDVLIGDAGCNVFSCVGSFLDQCSIWILLLLSIERFVAVWLPVKVSRWFTMYWARVLVIATASLFILINSTLLLLIYQEVGPSTHGIECSFYSVYGHHAKNVWYWTEICLTAIIPSVILILLNSLIIFKLGQIMTKQKQMILGIVNPDTLSYKTYVTLMFVTVSVAFILLVLSIALFYCIRSSSPHEKAVFLLTRELSHLLLKNIFISTIIDAQMHCNEDVLPAYRARNFLQDSTDGMKSETISSATNITYGLSLKMMSNYSVVIKSNVVLDLERLPTTLVSPSETNVTFQEYTEGAIALALNGYYLWVLLNFGLVFNTAVVLTISKLRPFITSSLYVILLAVFDTLALLSKLTYLKLTYYDVPIGDADCKVFSCVGSFLDQCSIWILILLIIERFVAVWLPLKVSRWFTMYRARVLIIATASCFILINSPLLFLVYQEVGPSAYGIECNFYSVYGHHAMNVWYWTEICLTAIILSVILILLNSLIIFKLKQSMKIKKQTTSRIANPNTEFYKTHVTLMLVTLSVTFILIVMPLVVFNFIRSSSPHEKELHLLTRELSNFLLLNIFISTILDVQGWRHCNEDVLSAYKARAFLSYKSIIEKPSHFDSAL